MIAKIVTLAIVIELFTGSLRHLVAQALGRHHTDMVAIEGQLLYQLIVDHHVERHAAALVAQALQLLQRVDGQCAQIVLHPAVTGDNDMLHLSAIRVRHAHDVVEKVVEVHIGIDVGDLIVIGKGEDAVERETGDELVVEDGGEKVPATAVLLQIIREDDALLGVESEALIVDGDGLLVGNGVK